MRRRTPRPPSPTPTRSTWLQRHPPSNRTGTARRLTHTTPRLSPSESQPTRIAPAQTRPPTRGITGQPHAKATLRRANPFAPNWRPRRSVRQPHRGHRPGRAGSAGRGSPHLEAELLCAATLSNWEPLTPRTRLGPDPHGRPPRVGSTRSADSATRCRERRFRSLPGHACRRRSCLHPSLEPGQRARQQCHERRARPRSRAWLEPPAPEPPRPRLLAPDRLPRSSPVTDPPQGRRRITDQRQVRSGRRQRRSPERLPAQAPLQLPSQLQLTHRSRSQSDPATVARLQILGCLTGFVLVRVTRERKHRSSRLIPVARANGPIRSVEPPVRTFRPRGAGISPM